MNLIKLLASTNYHCVFWTTVPITETKESMVTENKDQIQAFGSGIVKALKWKSYIEMLFVFILKIIILLINWRWENDRARREDPRT